jgi:dCMP deaminase
MSKWDNRMLALAGHIAGWSKDASSRVGAVIVDSKNRIVSVGYNGFPRGVADKEVSRSEKLRRTIHAEENALLFAERPVEGFTLYVTHPPCASCAAKLIQSGIARVVSLPPSDGFAERWVDDLVSADEMFAEADVTFELYWDSPA